MRYKRVEILAVAFILCLACRAFGVLDSNIGYVSDSSGAQLLTVDLATGQASVVGPFEIVSNVTGLAYDPVGNVMYGISAIGDALYTIDIELGTATLVGEFGLDDSLVMHGLTYDSKTNTLYSSASSQKNLYTIDVTTGTASVVASTNPTSISGLAIDPFEDILFGSPASLAGNGVYTIDKISGAATRIGTGMLAFNGLAFDPSNKRLYGVRNEDDSLYWIDTITGEGYLIGNLGINDVNPLGFEIVPEPMSATLLLLGSIIALQKRRR